MLRKANCRLTLVVLCGLGQATVAMADGPPFIGRLGLGTVELVGITYYQQTNQARWWNRAQWWHADGSAAQIGPFRPRGKHELELFADKKTVTFLVRVTLPSDSSLADKYKSSGAMPSERYVPSGTTPADRYVPSEQPSKSQAPYGQSTADASRVAWEFGSTPHWRYGMPMRWEGLEVVDARGNFLPGYMMVSVHFDAYTEMTDFRTRVSTSAYEWETVITRKSDSAGTSSFRRDGEEWKVTFGEAREAPRGGARQAPAGSTQVRLKVPPEVMCGTEFYLRFWTRLVAVANDGGEHASLIAYLGDDGTAVFRGLLPSSIKEFKFQVRPYDWVEFRNVSLQPGQRTSVTVVSSVDSANAKK